MWYNTYMNWILTAILLVNLGLFAVLAVFLLKLRGVYRDILSFITPENAGDESELSRLVKPVLNEFASKIVDNAKVTLMGYKSGQARADKAVEAAMAKDLINLKSPLAGAALGAFPFLQKLIDRNPGLAGAALEKLGSLGRNSPVESTIVTNAGDNGYNVFKT